MTLNVIFIMKQILLNDKIEYDMFVTCDDIKLTKEVVVKYSESSNWSNPGAPTLTVTDNSDFIRIAFPNGAVVNVQYYEMPALLASLLAIKGDKITITQQVKMFEI